MVTLTNEQKKQAEDGAAEVLQDTFGTLEDIQFPINLDEILERYDLSLKVGVFEDKNISGAFSRSDSSIYIAGGESPERRLFTVAHELGHYKLHDSRTTDILYRRQIWEFNGEDEEVDENQANWFAANLLMPTDAMKRMWKITTDVERLADFFGVSKRAMRLRIKHLGLKA